MARELKDEFTAKMHSEFTIDAETDKRLRAGCVWNVLKKDAPKEDVEEEAINYGIDYETAMRWRDYWFSKYSKYRI